MIVQLAAGRQYLKAISDIFGIDPSTVGSVEVDSDTNGVFGDILTVDSSFTAKYAVSLPLSARPVASAVLPYAGPTTRVVVFNPNSSATNVTATPFAADGKPSTALNAQVPAFGSATIAVSSNAYVTVGSTQPVVAAGWIDMPSGTTAGYLALPSSGAPIGGPPAAPQIAVTPASSDFGGLTVGQTADRVVTVRNNGTAPLNITVSVSGPFTVSPTSVAPIAAGSFLGIGIDPALALCVSCCVAALACGVWPCSRVAATALLCAALGVLRGGWAPRAAHDPRLDAALLDPTLDRGGREPVLLEGVAASWDPVPGGMSVVLDADLVEARPGDHPLPVSIRALLRVPLAEAERGARLRVFARLREPARALNCSTFKSEGDQ